MNPKTNLEHSNEQCRECSVEELACVIGGEDPKPNPNALSLAVMAASFVGAGAVLSSGGIPQDLAPSVTGSLITGAAAAGFIVQGKQPKTDK